MRSILEWPYFQQHEMQTVLLRPDEEARRAAGGCDYDVEAAMPSARQEAAANQIVRSFRRSRGRAESRQAQVMAPERVTQGFKELPAAVRAAVDAGGGVNPRPHSRYSPRGAPKVSQPTAPTAYDSQVCEPLCVCCCACTSQRPLVCCFSRKRSRATGRVAMRGMFPRSLLLRQRQTRHASLTPACDDARTLCNQSVQHNLNLCVECVRQRYFPPHKNAHRSARPSVARVLDGRRSSALPLAIFQESYTKTPSLSKRHRSTVQQR